MHRLRLSAAAILLVAGAYLATKFLIGYQVQQYVALNSDRLEAHEAFEVTRLDYERGLLGGRLHYDLIYRPLSDSGANRALRNWYGESRLALQGTADVQHGPWLGDAGAGLAKADMALPLPRGSRDWLPDHSTDAPLMNLRAAWRFSGRTDLRLRIRDYAGRFQPRGQPPTLALTVRGARAELAIERNLEQVASDFRAEELRLEAPGGQTSLAVADLQGDSDHRRGDAGVWHGNASAHLSRVQIEDRRTPILLEGLSLTTDTAVEQEVLRHDLSVELASAAIADRRFNQARLAVAVEDIPVRPYARLMQALQQATLARERPGAEELRPMVERILAHGLAVSIEDFSASIADSLDTSAGLSLRYTGPGELEALRLETLRQYVTVQARARSTEPALHRAVTAYIDDRYPEASSSEREEAADRFTRQIVQTLGRIGVERGEDGTISARARFSDGTLTLNDQTVPYGRQLVTLLVNSLSPPDGARQ